MTYRGHVKNGQITLDEPVSLPEGTKLNIEIVDSHEQEPTVWEKLLELAGSVEGPSDWAENHDHYIHGTPRRES